MFLPRTTLCVPGSYSTVFSTAHRSGLFLLTRGFPRCVEEAPKGRVPRGKPSPGLALHPGGGTRASLPGAPGWQLSQAKKHVGFASRINRRGSPLVPLRSPSHARVPTCSPAPINGSSRRFCPPLPCRRRAGSRVRVHGRRRLCWSF